MIGINLKRINEALKNKTPEEIINWALTLSDKRIVSTSFGSYSAVLLSAMSNKDKNIKVVWCDTGYNTNKTYEHAITLINTLNLNINIYSPRHSKSFIDSTIGLPGIDDLMFQKFTDIVKLEPFRRALTEHKPDVWFTNIRINQTEHRNSKGVLSFSKEGILKVSPFYHYTDNDLDTYLKENCLSKNDSYFDVTKVLPNRECGIQLQ